MKRYLTGEPFPQPATAEIHSLPQPERRSLPQPEHYSQPHPEHSPRAYRRDINQLEAPSPLVEYWKILRRYRWAIVLITLAGALAGLLVALPQTKVYRSQTTVEIQAFNE